MSSLPPTSRPDWAVEIASPSPSRSTQSPPASIAGGDSQQKTPTMVLHSDFTYHKGRKRYRHHLTGTACRSSLKETVTPVIGSLRQALGPVLSVINRSRKMAEILTPGVYTDSPQQRMKIQESWTCDATKAFEREQGKSQSRIIFCDSREAYAQAVSRFTTKKARDLRTTRTLQDYGLDNNCATDDEGSDDTHQGTHANHVGDVSLTEDLRDSGSRIYHDDADTHDPEDVRGTQSEPERTFPDSDDEDSTL